VKLTIDGDLPWSKGPKADGVMTEGYHGISAELPGVAVGDLQILRKMEL